ncbi:META domain-containing protein [Streptomyces sp. NPDC014894]|uniref:META domain-containing protein n=1 Tax=Streptomyces sp. NPDC014894 TaxID=3364931 RepID=UPI0036FEA9EF
MRNELSVPLTVLALLTLAACGSGSGNGDGDGVGKASAPDVPLAGVHWSFDSVTVGGEKTTAPDGAHVEITEKGRAQGNYGCNPFGATAKVDGDTLAVGAAESTAVGCEPSAQKFEEKVQTVFTGRLKAQLTGKKLTLTSGGGDTIALTSEEPAPLIGTTWTVNSLLDGDVATPMPAGTAKGARFTFTKDGKVRGNLGCNSFTAPAKITGSKITLGRVAATRMMCAGTAGQVEAHLLKVLDQEVTYNLLHRGLTLTGPGDKRVSAVAER